MHPERRTYLREHARLPFAWQPISAQASEAALWDAFDMQPHYQLRSIAAGLQQLTAIAQQIPDSDIKLCVLQLIDNQRLLCAQSASAPTPEVTSVELSVSAFKFECTQPPALATPLALCLVPSADVPMVVRARVQCVRPDGERFAVVAALDKEDAAVTRQLQTLLLRLQRQRIH
ncbi:MAG: hypothetical protein AAF513_15495 [Pseudomonadota bacterium]